MKNIKLENLNYFPDDDEMLYRYVTFDKLLDFIINGQIPLSRLDTFDDKLEGISYNHIYWRRMAKKAGKARGQEAKKAILDVSEKVKFHDELTLPENKELFQKTHFASCWYRKENESVAMWQLYSRQDSVAIRIPFGELFKQLEENDIVLNPEIVNIIKYGNVQYYQYNTEKGIDNMLYGESIPGFVKDLSFDHENEFRLVAKSIEVSESKIIKMKLLKFKEMPFEIIFHPKAQLWHKTNIKNLLDKYEIPFKTNESELEEIFK